MNFRKSYIIIMAICLLLIFSNSASAAVVWQDDFNRGDSATVGGDWTDSGTWEIKGQSLFHNNAAGDYVATTNATGGWNTFKINSTVINGLTFYNRNSANNLILQILFSTATQITYNNGGGQTNCGGTGHTYTTGDFITVNKTTSPYQVWLYSGGNYTNLCSITTTYNFGVGAGYIQVAADASLGVRALSLVCSSDAKEDCIPAPVLSPTITINSPSNASVQYETSNTFTLSTTASNFGGTVTTSQYLYNSSFGLVQSFSNASASVANLFTLPATGVYYFNASASNTTASNITEIRQITLYKIVQNGINTPANNSIANGDINVSWNASTITPSGASVSKYNASLYNSTGYVATLNNSLFLNTSFVFNAYALGLVKGAYTARVYTYDSNNNAVYQNVAFNITKDAQVIVTAYSAKTGGIITTYSVNITDLDTGEFQTKNTTNGNVTFDAVKGDRVNFLFDAPLYALQSFNHTLTANTYQHINDTLAANNSVTVYLYDEETSLPIMENISLAITGTNYSLTTSTATSTLLIEALPANSYTFQFSGANYTVKSYLVTVSDRSAQNLNAFLSKSTSTVIFTINDYNSGLAIEGANLLVERMYNGSFTTVDNKLSDITGRVQIVYLPNTLYRFTASKTNYSSKVFTLNPVIFSTYTVSLIRSSSQISNQDYANVGVNFYPKSIENNVNTTFTFIIVSPLGKLENSSVLVKYPGGSQYQSSSNAYGATFTFVLNVSNAPFGSKVNLTYAYKATDVTFKIFNYPLEIYGYTGANQTYIDLKNHDYGMGPGEKIILLTVAVMILAGFAYAIAGLGPGLAVGLIVFGIGVYLNFANIWAILITVLVGLFIMFKLGGDNVG